MGGSLGECEGVENVWWGYGHDEVVGRVRVGSKEVDRVRVVCSSSDRPYFATVISTSLLY